MKYIDAEKLIAEIEMRIAQWQSYTFACASQIASEAFDRIDELKGLLIYITSLQQEQSEADFEDKFAKFLERKDAELGANSWSEEDLRELAEYFYFNNKKPEVNLEKEVKSYIKDNYTIMDEVAQIPEEDRMYAMREDDMMAFAKHFYELRLNARKEE